LAGLAGHLRALLQRLESGQLAKAARAEWQRYRQRPLAEQDPAKRATLQAQLAALDAQ
jgi:hypothetical protein